LDRIDRLRLEYPAAGWRYAMDLESLLLGAALCEISDDETYLWYTSYRTLQVRQISPRGSGLLKLSILL